MWLEFSGDKERRICGWRGRQQSFHTGNGQHMRLRLHLKYHVRRLEGVSKGRKEGHEFPYIFRRMN